MTSFLIYLKIIWENRKTILVVSALGVLASFYIYYLRTSHLIENLKQEKQHLEEVVEKQQKQMQLLKESYEKIIASKEELNKQIIEAQKELDELRNKLFRENHGKMSLEELARKKPALVEKIINKATEDVLNCFETMSNGKECK
jgi:septal ring factor EnvC (AmiA/AmiB activator)